MTDVRKIAEGRTVRTYTPKVNEIVRDWHVIDAEGLVLGRVATVAASLLRCLLYTSDAADE